MRGDTFRARTRFVSLDGLRCFAIVPVYWHHATTGPLPGVLGRGPLGVDLFFVISGFLITTLLLREHDRTGTISIRGFFARRSLRIFPVYYGVLALYVLYAWWLMPVAPQRAHFLDSVPFYATYTANWLVDFNVPHPVSFAFAWSLCAEEQFYLLWGAVFGVASAVASFGWRAAMLVVPGVVAVGLLAVDQGVEHGMWLTALPPGHVARRIAASIASPICMGALLGLILHARTGFQVLGRALGARFGAAWALVGLIVSAVADGVPAWVAQVLMTLLVGAVSVRADHAIRPLTDGRGLRWIGTVSYGIYLFHVAVITLARRLLPAALGTPGWVFALAFPVTVALASVSYIWFERPILRLRARLAAA